MRTRLRHIWEVVTTGYWFVPALMSSVAIGLAFVMLYLDRVRITEADEFVWLYPGGAEGASNLLSTVAASTITVASVAFSITIAALSQASSQFGPRLLRNFMRDTANQVVLGTLAGTFLYCLLILRSVHGETDVGGAFVPHASVTVAVVLAIASIAMLIFFIHHISVSLQAPAVVSAVASELSRTIRRMPHDQAGAAVPAVEEIDLLPPEAKHSGRPVSSEGEGYVQAINYEMLMAIASRHDVVLLMEPRAGDHVIKETTLLRVWPATRWSPELSREANGAFIFGRQATPEQDLEFAVRQLVEVAVRALSPGINDPFTALNCIDALAEGLCRVARHGLTGPYRHDKEGKLRIVTRVTTFPGLADAAFHQIRQYGRNSVAVIIHMLDVIAKCAPQMKTDEQRMALLRHARMIHADAIHHIQNESDREDIRARFTKAAQSLGSV